jgi:ComF family protein
VSAIRRAAGDLAAGLLDLVFAPVCVSCSRPVGSGAVERLVCGLCWARCRPVPAPRCPRCWGPTPPGAAPAPVCRVCGEWPPALRALRSAFAVGDVPRALVHALKYRGWEAVAEVMAARMAALPWPDDVVEEARLVVPVPASRVRLRERGYNQAELRARGLVARSGRQVVPDLLARTRSTGTQTALHPSERRANVAGAFAAPVNAATRLRGQHVLLVDDVWTTGATATACAQALLEGGARVVSVATFARVVPELER